MAGLHDDLNSEGPHEDSREKCTYPLDFFNDWKEENKQARIIAKSPDVVFAGSDLVIKKIRDRLPTLSIPNMCMQPATYVDDDQRHEDYAHVTFTADFDCWDREKSDYKQEEPPIQANGVGLHLVYSYRLDEKLMQKTPSEARLLFKMGATLPRLIVCHISLISFFQDQGAQLDRICDD